jgi:FAD synthase
MPQIGFKPTIPASKRVATFHALDHSATVTGKHQPYVGYLNLFYDMQSKFQNKAELNKKTREVHLMTSLNIFLVAFT